MGTQQKLHRSAVPSRALAGFVREVRVAPASTDAGEDARWRELASREAALVLGELLLRQGRPNEAVELLRSAAAAASVFCGG